MQPFLRRISLVSAFIAASPCVLATELPTGMKVGQLFPDIVLPELRTGKLTSIASYRGDKILLLVFASW